MNRPPVTAAGAEELNKELERLKKEERPKIVQSIAEAREHGDLKENAEYHAAREQQGFCEGRIQELEGVLSNAQVIDVAVVGAANAGKVVFGEFINMLLRVNYLFFAITVLLCSQLLSANPEQDEVRRSALSERFSTLHNAYVARDFELAYSIEDPDHRAKYTFEDYLAKIDDGFKWKSVILNNIEFNGENEATVDYTSDFSFKLPWGVEFDNNSRNMEKWFLKDDEWWRSKITNSLPGGN